MKIILAYAFLFIFTFLGTTGIIYFFNDNFQNIFVLDFRGPQKIEEPVVERKLNLENSNLDAYTKNVIKEVQEELVASLENYNKSASVADTVYKEVVKIVPDQKILDSLEVLSKAKKEAEKGFAQKEKELSQLREALGLNNEKEYNDWISATVKLYESMDSKKAAKILTGYSDNVARDIIYSMKKKKAAEILSNLNSEQIVKLTRADDGL